MNSELWAPMFLAASGLSQAAFAIPMKHFRGWRWEQVWVAQSITANILLPLAWAAVAPAAFWEQMPGIPLSNWIVSYALGLVWGLGGVAYGLTITRLGMAFANSFIFGVTVVTGALVPLALGVVELPASPMRFAAGLALCVAAAGSIAVFRGRGSQKPLLALPMALSSYRCVVLIAITSGLASSGYGLAFSFSFATIRSLAVHGISPLTASLVVVLPVYLGASCVAIPVGLIFAKRTYTMPLFVARHAMWNWFLAVLMGLCAAATVVLYGLGGTTQGHPPPNVSFGIFMTFLVLGGNALGLATGEMRGNAPRVNLGLLVGSCGLIFAAWLLSSL